MSNSTHGPWRVAKDPSRDRLLITAASRKGKVEIALIDVGFNGPVEDEQQANARLIAAAPKMLSTLEAVERRLARVDGFDGTKEIIRAAIAAATGAA